jgi:hypothetical protein
MNTWCPPKSPGDFGGKSSISLGMLIAVVLAKFFKFLKSLAMYGTESHKRTVASVDRGKR